MEPAIILNGLVCGALVIGVSVSAECKAPIVAGFLCFVACAIARFL